MHKTFLCAVLAILAALAAFAQSPGGFYQWYTVWSATTTGAVSSIRCEANYHTLQVVITGTPTACTVRLEGSLDNTNWADVSGTQSCMGTLSSGATGVVFHVDTKPLSYVRANLLTFTGATSAQITYKGSN